MDGLFSSKDWTKLLLVTNKNHLICIEESFKSLQFMGLSRFIYDNLAEVHVLEDITFSCFASGNNDRYFFNH